MIRSGRHKGVMGKEGEGSSQGTCIKDPQTRKMGGRTGRVMGGVGIIVIKQQ